MREDATDEAVADVSEEDEATLQDLPSVAPTYDRAPPTIEERISPFHPSAQGSKRGPGGTTLPGMPPPAKVGPAIRSATPTAPGLAGVGAGPVVAPRIVRAPEVSPPDGPTDPDGVPAAFAAAQIVGADGPTDPDGVLAADTWDGPTDPESGWEAATTDPRARAPRPTPEVPAPDAPKVEMSKSLELQVAQLEEEPRPDPARPPAVSAAKRAVQAPTYQMLPALKRKERAKSGSDWPLVLGLVALALVILGLIGAVVYGVVQTFGAPEPPAVEGPG
jgi:hypothetical protein